MNPFCYNAVMFFIALAVADGAIKGVKTVEDLKKIRIPTGKESWQLEWEDSAQDLLVFRQGDGQNRALSYSTLNTQLTVLSKYVGFKDALRVHTVSRQVAVDVDSM